MDTCSVTHFKNHALKILSEISDSGEELVVTRHGKPLAHIEPVRTAKHVQLGKLAGTMKIEGDIVGPLGADDWEACK